MPDVQGSKTDFRVLFAVFLGRIVDLDLLSAAADTNVLLSQLGALFAGGSLLLTAPLVLVGGGLPIEDLRLMEHFLIATSMLLTGAIYVLAWESSFPERLDLLILGPLPVRLQIIFAAKLSSLIGALGLSLLALNSFTGLVWPFLFSPPGQGAIGLLRSFAAYWGTILLACTFVFSVGLAIQGLLSLMLPRQLFLRLAVWIQVTAFAGLLALYILEPSLEAPEALVSPTNHHLLAVLPSYWFFGLFEQLNGSSFSGTAPLAQRAWSAVAIVVEAACCVVVVGYLRLLRHVVEQPDMRARSGRLSAYLQTQTGSAAATLFFSITTVFRSRKHRVLLAFYWGVGATLVYVVAHPSIAGVRAAMLNPSTGPLKSYLMASLLLVSLGVGALRFLTALPVAAKAEWLFRMTEFDSPSVYRGASARLLLWLGCLPPWLFLSATALVVWPGWRSCMFVVALGSFGFLLITASTLSLRKAPFACAYTPGRGQVHLAFWTGLFVLLPSARATARLFHWGLGSPAKGVLLIALLLAAMRALALRSRLQDSKRYGMVFADESAEDLRALNLGLQ